MAALSLPADVWRFIIRDLDVLDYVNIVSVCSYIYKCKNAELYEQKKQMYLKQKRINDAKKTLLNMNGIIDEKYDDNEITFGSDLESMIKATQQNFPTELFANATFDKERLKKLWEIFNPLFQNPDILNKFACAMEIGTIETIAQTIGETLKYFFIKKKLGQ